MDLEDFKTIFFWEWFHRFLGRVVGLVYALPLAYFWIKGLIPQGRKLALVGLLLLGAAQGLMGWIMVKSGLVDHPDVSHIRLAAHLSLALIIYAALLWQALSIKNAAKTPNAPLFRHGIITLAFVALAIIWGAFTAGLNAGLIYNNTFPQMGGRWIPDEITASTHSLLYTIFEIPAAVQFMHRWLAMAAAAMVLAFCAHAHIKGHFSTPLKLLALAVVLQFGLGLATLMSGVSLPLAVMHQSGAVLVLTFLILGLYRFKP
jgi:cytochrome c oxidase assembly protein subunit 15